MGANSNKKGGMTRQRDSPKNPTKAITRRLRFAAAALKTRVTDVPRFKSGLWDVKVKCNFLLVALMDFAPFSW